MITLFGSIFLPLTVLILAFKRDWLLPLLVVSAVFQAPAVINVPLGEARYGITPFNLVALAIFFHFIERIIQRRKIHLGPPAVRPALLLILGYGITAIFGAFTLPFLFEGVPVYLLINSFGFDAHTTPLHWTISNAAQAVNTAILMMIFLYAVDQMEDEQLPRRMLWGFGIAVVASLAVGVHQRLGWQGVIEMPVDWWASNATYAQNWRTGGVLGYIRVSWPFTEPSYASAWFATALVGATAAAIYSRPAWPWIALLLLAGAGLLNSLGATGMVAAPIALGLLILWLAITAWRVPPHRPWLRRRVPWALIPLVILPLVTASVLFSAPGQALQQAIEKYRTKVDHEIEHGTARKRSDLHALDLIQQTRGLGTGLGSNRSNSFLMSMASNTGVGPTLLILTALLYLIGRALKQILQVTPPIPAPAPLAIGALTTATIATFAAIPDINWPVWWLMLLLALLGVGVRQANNGQEANAATAN